MDFRFTPEQDQFRESVRRFAEKHLAAGARERAHSPDYPWDVAKLMAAQGLLGITVAEADGGQGGALIAGRPVAEGEINPLIVKREGVVAVDGLVVMKEQDFSPPH